jgi:hypothetical protein
MIMVRYRVILTCAVDVEAPCASMAFEKAMKKSIRNSGTFAYSDIKRIEGDD